MTKWKVHTSHTKKIHIPLAKLVLLEAWCANARGNEISGVGTAHIQDGEVHVDEVYLLAGGSAGYTEIQPAMFVDLVKQGVDLTKVKVWFHCHPMGDGIPGPHNWSGTDEHTARNEPLGSTPELVGWSASIVRTPRGWVGRIDHYRKGYTVHLGVAQPLTPEDHARVTEILAVNKPAPVAMPTGPTGPLSTGPRDPVPMVLPPKQTLWNKVKTALAPRTKTALLPKRPSDDMLRKEYVQEALAQQIAEENGLEPETIWCIQSDLNDMLPEIVAALYDISIDVLLDLGLLSGDEYDAAMKRNDWWDIHGDAVEAGEYRWDEIPEGIRERLHEGLGHMGWSGKGASP